MKSIKAKLKNQKFYNRAFFLCAIILSTQTIFGFIVNDWLIAFCSLSWSIASWLNWLQFADMQRLLRIILVQKKIINEISKKANK